MVKKWHLIFGMLSLLFVSGCGSLGVIRTTFKTMKSGEMSVKNFRQEIPFTYIKTMIVIEARLNDEEKARKFVLDTGALLSLKKSALPETGIRKIGELPVASANSQVGYLDAMVLDKISIGDVVVENIGLAVVNDDSMSAENPVLGCFFEQVDGLIGSNVMRYARWEIDHQRQIITITDDKEAFPPASNSIVVPFKNTPQGVPMVTGTINGGKESAFIVDTGSGGYFQLQSKLLETLEKDSAIRKTEIVGETASGVFGADKGKTLMVKVDSIHLPGIHLNKVIAGSIKSRFNLLGNAFMIHYNSVFDWEKESITFTPIDSSYQLPQQIESFGFGFAYSDSMQGLYIASLYSESQAAKTHGIEIDLPIYSMAGKPTQNITHSQYCEFLLQSTPDSIQQMPLEVMQGDSLRKLLIQKESFLKD